MLVGVLLQVLISVAEAKSKTRVLEVNDLRTSTFNGLYDTSTANSA